MAEHSFSVTSTMYASFKRGVVSGRYVIRGSGGQWCVLEVAPQQVIVSASGGSWADDGLFERILPDISSAVYRDWRDGLYHCAMSDGIVRLNSSNGVASREEDWAWIVDNLMGVWIADIIKDCHFVGAPMVSYRDFISIADENAGVLMRQFRLEDSFDGSSFAVFHVSCRGGVTLEDVGGSLGEWLNNPKNSSAVRALAGCFTGSFRETYSVEQPMFTLGSTDVFMDYLAGRIQAIASGKAWTVVDDGYGSVADLFSGSFGEVSEIEVADESDKSVKRVSLWEKF